MAVFTGYVALGTGVSNLGVFQECTTYTRSAISLTGNAVAGLTQSLGQITGPTGPVGGIITKGAFFDALTGGNCLCYWDWNVITAVPANFAAVTLNVALNSYLQQALNMSSLGGQASSGAAIDAGAQIGTMIGNPLLAGVRLGIQSGALVALGTQKVLDIANGLLFQANGLNVGGVSSTGILTGSAADTLTAHAGGGQGAALPITTGAARFTTVTTSLDSAILPVCPAGSMVAIKNDGTTTLNLYPDVGASINAGAANAALAFPTVKSALLVRTSPTEWVSIPTVPT